MSAHLIMSWLFEENCYNMPVAQTSEPGVRERRMHDRSFRVPDRKPCSLHGNFFTFLHKKWRVLMHTGAWILKLIMCQPAREGSWRLDVFNTVSTQQGRPFFPGRGYVRTHRMIRTPWLRACTRMSDLVRKISAKKIVAWHLCQWNDP